MVGRVADQGPTRPGCLSEEVELFAGAVETLDLGGCGYALVQARGRGADGLPVEGLRVGTYLGELRLGSRS